MNKPISYKSFFTDYGIFIAILVVLFGLLIYPIKAGQKAWQNNLKNTVETVLEESEPNTWTVGNPVKINNSFQLNAACYEARNRKTGDVHKAIIIRIQSFYGPLPAVFTVDKDSNITFVGYCGIHGRVLEQLNSNRNSSRINYWKVKIPEILE